MRPTPTIEVDRVVAEWIVRGKLNELDVPRRMKQGDLIEVKVKGGRSWDAVWVIVHAIPPVEGGLCAVRLMDVSPVFLRPTSDGGSTTSYTDYTDRIDKAMPFEPESVDSATQKWIAARSAVLRDERFEAEQAGRETRRVADRLEAIRMVAGVRRLDFRSELRAIEKLLQGDRKRRTRAMAGLARLERRLFW